MLTEEALEIMLAMRQDSEGEWPRFEEGLNPSLLTEALVKLMQMPDLIQNLRRWCPDFGRGAPGDTEDVFAQLDEYLSLGTRYQDWYRPQWQGPGPRVAPFDDRRLPDIDVD